MALFNGDILLKFILWNFQIYPKAERLVFSLLAIYQYFVDLMSSIPLLPPRICIRSSTDRSFFFVTALLRSDSYTKQFAYFKVCDSAVFSTFTELCDHQLDEVWNIFITPPRTLYPLAVPSPVPPFSLSPLSPDFSLLPFSPLSPQPWPLGPAFPLSPLSPDLSLPAFLSLSPAFLSSLPSSPRLLVGTLYE